MKRSPFGLAFAAILYGAISLTANVVDATELSAADITSLKELRHGDMAKLIVHAAPRDRIAETFRDLYGNAGGDWVDDIAYQLQDDGNLHADPLFCDLAAGDLTLFNISPCLPENSLCGTLAGAWSQGCSLLLQGTADFDDMPQFLLSKNKVPL